MSHNIPELKPAEQTHKDCSVQYLGRDFSLGIAKKAYFCMTHGTAFAITIPIKKGVEK